MLESISEVVAAEGIISLSLAIIESGISNLTNTRRHVEAALKASGGGKKGGLRECKEAYYEVGGGAFIDARAGKS